MYITNYSFRAELERLQQSITVNWTKMHDVVMFTELVARTNYKNLPFK